MKYSKCLYLKLTEKVAQYIQKIQLHLEYFQNLILMIEEIVLKLSLFNLKPLGKNLHFTLRSDLLLSLSLLWNDPHARVIPSSAFYNLSDLLITISLYFLMSFVHVGLDHITIHIFTILMSLLQSQLWLSHLASDLLAVRLFLYQDMTDLQ